MLVANAPHKRSPSFILQISSSLNRDIISEGRSQRKQRARVEPHTLLIIRKSTLTILITVLLLEHALVDQTVILDWGQCNSISLLLTCTGRWAGEEIAQLVTVLG